MIKGYELAKLFSETEYEESEKIFSTGNEELDTLLEKVYSEGVETGYEYAQKEFSSKEEKAKMRLGDRYPKTKIIWGSKMY